ncbi:hypothetical protein MKK84_09240, partial [Methylobacterium sp. E-065]|nr:hypothetical protein [Methylobacterium sp. E-065]
MLVVETVAKIRRAYFVQQKPIKQICRELKVSRKVVRKVIRSEATPAFGQTATWRAARRARSTGLPSASRPTVRMAHILVIGASQGIGLETV